jgi:hypothetical protein
VELHRLDRRRRQIGQECGPVEMKFLDADFVKRDEVLDRSIARRVLAVEQMQIDPGLPRFD